MAPKRVPRPKGDQGLQDTPEQAKERTRATAIITTNWGQAFSTMQNWMHDNTWLKGETERLSEQTCEMETIRAFRTLSQNTPNRGQEVKDQIQQYYLLRWYNTTKTTPIGSTKPEKEKNIRADLGKLSAGRFIPEANWKENKTKRPRAEKVSGKKAKPRKKSKKDVSSEEPDQDGSDRSNPDKDEEGEEEEDEPRPPPHPKPAAKPARNEAVDGTKPRTRSEVKKREEKVGKENNNAKEAEDDNDTASIISEPPQVKTIHTPEDKDMALIRIYSNWQIDSLHRDFPAMLRGADSDAPEDTGIEDVIVELLRDLSERFPTKRQSEKIREELELRFKRMKRYSLKAVHLAITTTAENYRWASASESEDEGPEPSNHEGNQDERGPQLEAAPPATRPDGQRRYAARSDEASFEMQAAWDAVVVAEAAVKVAQDQRVLAALESETAYEQATRQLKVSKEQLRVATEYAKARCLGRPQRVGETVGPSEENRGQRRRGDVGGAEEGLEQQREGGDDEVDVREREGNGEGDENEGEDGSIPFN
ncbi:hypothetical protein J4E91_004917 [Alternaria rosae]|nr:hypothetical protein J4E91_004917 [Alternaria rosae]